MEETFKGRDVISIEDFSKNEIDFILDKAGEAEHESLKYGDKMKGRIMAPLFFEPSTRTASSFQMAVWQLGGMVMDFDVFSSSVKKGETLKDTARMINGYGADVVVVRHNKDGSSRLVADVISAPVINAGDGKNQHPTQTLLDLYTIKELKGKIDGLKIAMVGDLKYGRTVHSLSSALTNYNGCEIFFVSPEELKMPAEIVKNISSKTEVYEIALDGLEGVIRDADILYMTRIQRERFPEGPEGEQQYKKISLRYRLSKQMLERAKPKEDFRIMHPLPKIDEIEPCIDDTKYAIYFKQAENGLYVRKALLALVAGAENG